MEILGWSRVEDQAPGPFGEREESVWTVVRIGRQRGDVRRQDGVIIPAQVRESRFER